jgi:hypothetical protein
MSSNSWLIVAYIAAWIVVPLLGMAGLDFVAGRRDEDGREVRHA